MTGETRHLRERIVLALEAVDAADIEAPEYEDYADAVMDVIEASYDAARRRSGTAMGNRGGDNGPSLRPFFSFYGGKWRAYRRYPAPHYDAIVEPFAGSAGYATRYPDRQVSLYDADEAVAGVWDYLINTPEAEIRRLPLDFGHVDELTAIPQEARWLIGFWLNHGAAAPCKTPSAWMRAGKHATSFWGPEIRERIASQVQHIRHWTITHGQYDKAPNDPATWFVDPPYVTPAGRHYRHHVIDYEVLGEWCQERIGQTIVCEQAGADWLPFRSIGATKSTLGQSREVAWLTCDSEAVA